MLERIVFADQYPSKLIHTSINRGVASRIFRNHRVSNGVFVTIKSLRVAQRPCFLPLQTFLLICRLISTSVIYTFKVLSSPAAISTGSKSCSDNCSTQLLVADYFNDRLLLTCASTASTSILQQTSIHTRICLDTRVFTAHHSNQRYPTSEDTSQKPVTS